MTPKIDCQRIHVRLSEICKAATSAKKMLADCNTGRQFDAALRAIEIQAGAIRSEVYGY